MRWLDAWRQRHGPHAALFGAPPDAERISLDLETTGLDVATCRVLSIAAVPVGAGCVHTSRALVLKVKSAEAIGIDSMRHHRLRQVDLVDGLSIEDALSQLLAYIGARPLLGYCIDFDAGVLSRLCRARFGFALPNPRLELSHRYERWWRQRNPGVEPRLDFDSILAGLSIPPLGRHDAYADAVAAGLAWLLLDQRGV